MENLDVARSLAALGQPLRLEIFRALVVAGHSGLTTSALLDAFAARGASLSFHLNELTHVGLVACDSQKGHLVYRAVFDHVDELFASLTKNCCAGELCKVSSYS